MTPDEAAFFEAVEAGGLARVRELLAANPSLLNARDGGGATPLHVAAFNWNQPLVRFLVEQGADVNARDGRFGATPAGWAIEFLREKGALLGMEIEDLLHAVRQGDVAWARRVLARLPALARSKDRGGKPLLDHARDSGNAELEGLFTEAARRTG